MTLSLSDSLQKVSHKVKQQKSCYLRSVAFSDSPPNAKLSRPEQTLTRRLDEKKPPSDIPISRKAFALSRLFALGLRSLL